MAPRKDLTGMVFGRLTVLGDSGKKDRRRSTLWRCRCACGALCLKPTNELNAGSARSCGCVWRAHTVHKGDRFGRLTVLEATDRRISREVVWRCQCDCGNITEVRTSHLTNGHTGSCGCIKRELDDQGAIQNHLTYVDGTCVEFARDIAKPRANTSPDTGIRGVILLRSGKYRAGITFRGKHYYLGIYSSLEDAAKARRRGEDMVQDYLEQRGVERSPAKANLHPPQKLRTKYERMESP